jgi:hypothetical protein
MPSCMSINHLAGLPFLLANLACLSAQPSTTVVAQSDLQGLIAKGPLLTFAPPVPLVAPIDKKTTTFNFPTGSSPFLVIQLPDFTAPYAFRVSSDCKCFGFKKQIFAPAVAIFDKDYNLTRSVPEDAFVVEEPSMSRPMRAEANIEVGEGNRGEKYLIVYTDGTKAGSTAGVIRGSMNGSLIKYPFYRGLEGKVRLEIPTVKGAKKR